MHDKTLSTHTRFLTMFTAPAIHRTLSYLGLETTREHVLHSIHNDPRSNLGRRASEYGLPNDFNADVPRTTLLREHGLPHPVAVGWLRLVGKCAVGDMHRHTNLHRSPCSTAYQTVWQSCSNRVAIT